MTQYPMLQSLFSPFRRSQQKTLALVIAAIAEVAQAASFAVAGHQAVELGLQLGRALNRFYRLLRHPRIDDQHITAQWLRLVGQGRRLLLALDWTEWHHPLTRLVASVVVGNRAIPVQTAVFNKTQILRSQNTWENTSLRRLVQTLRAIGQASLAECPFHPTASPLASTPSLHRTSQFSQRSPSPCSFLRCAAALAFVCLR